MPDRDVILSAVRRAQRRLNLARLASNLAAAARLVFAAALLLELASVALPAARALVPWVVAAGLGGAALGLGAWRLRQRAPDRAAAALDRAARLGDELRTAHWFIGRDDSSPWLDVLVRRAAASVSRLDVRRLVPVRAPRRETAGALVLAAAVVGVGMLPLELAHQSITAPAVVALTPEEQARLDQLQQILNRMAPVGGRGARARIESLLTRLREGRLSVEETLAIVAELRRLVGEPATDEAERQALARAATALQMADLTREAGEALGAGAFEDAADRLSDLASTLPSDVGRDAEQALDRAGREAGATRGLLGEHMQEAAAAMRKGDADARARASRRRPAT